jgi:hypothetical protein
MRTSATRIVGLVISMVFPTSYSQVGGGLVVRGVVRERAPTDKENHVYEYSFRHEVETYARAGIAVREG